MNIEQFAEDVKKLATSINEIFSHILLLSDHPEDFIEQVNDRQERLQGMIKRADILIRTVTATTRNSGGRVEILTHLERSQPFYAYLFHEAAKRRHGNDGGEIDFGQVADSIVSVNGESDAYVLAWCYVPKEELEFPRRFQGALHAKDADRRQTFLGEDSVIARNQHEAESMLMDVFWDDRLNDCIPVFDWEDLPMEEFDVRITYWIPDDNGHPGLANHLNWVVPQHQFEDVRPALELILPKDFVEIRIDGESRYRNYYQCSHCGASWQEDANCTCNDRCPNCYTEIEPYESEEITE